MNFIFDIGNVLIDFKPKLFLHRLFDNPSEEEKVYKIIFESDEWVNLDRGAIMPEEACTNFCLREPQYQQLIHKAMENLTEMLTPLSKTIELLPQIKASGHRLYFLSNYHKELSRYVQDQYSFFQFI